RMGHRSGFSVPVLFLNHLSAGEPRAGRCSPGTLGWCVGRVFYLLGPALRTRPAFTPKFSERRFHKKGQITCGRSSSSYSRSTCMKTQSHGFAQKLRRILRSVVRESNDRHNPLLINSLTAFNFRPPLEFPREKLARSGAFSR